MKLKVTALHQMMLWVAGIFSAAMDEMSPSFCIVWNAVVAFYKEILIVIFLFGVAVAGKWAFLRLLFRLSCSLLATTLSGIAIAIQGAFLSVARFSEYGLDLLRHSVVPPPATTSYTLVKVLQHVLMMISLFIYLFLNRTSSTVDSVAKWSQELHTSSHQESVDWFVAERDRSVCPERVRAMNNILTILGHEEDLNASAPEENA